MAVWHILVLIMHEIKTESTRKLSNFKFQGTKSLYQNSLKNIAFFFYIFQALKMLLLVIRHNTKDYFSWESEKMNVKFHKNCESTGEILKISCVKCNFVKFDNHFVGLALLDFSLFSLF